jgi:eukaryotic-like serine/threonine-protein kinase
MSDVNRRWPRVKEIFDQALARPPDRRTAFVRGECGDDLALADEVLSLLAAHAAAGSFAEQPAIARVAAGGASIAAGPTPAMPSGFELGTYRILGPLDAGGMGEVYRALDTRLHRDVAIKVLPAALSDDRDRVARLEREARLLAALNHPYIATIHGLEITGGRHAIVMELVEGPTLAERLSAAPLSADEALLLARQVAEALEAAHEKGIVHRDLKPANIKLTAAGTVKVLDFGLAKTMSSEGRQPVPSVTSAPGSRDGLVVGTPGYMSPEQFSGQPVDGRSDVWAFACVLYEMLTGHQAFGETSISQTSAAILESQPDWERLPASVPAGVRRVLRRCLQRDVRQRLHHIADVRIELEDAIDDRDGRAVALLAAVNRRRARVLGFSTAVLALTVMAMLAAWVMRTPLNAPELRVVEITTPRTSDPASFAMSPDGRRLAFVAERDGQPMLWVRDLDAANSRALPGTEGARRPFWSPDSRSIAFFMNSELKRIEARGGAPQTITYLLAGTTGTWGSDGTILFSSTASPSLRRISAAGGAVQVETTPAADSSGHRHPQFLPGSRQYLFFVGGPDAVRGVYLGTLGSSDATRLVASDTQGAYISPGWLLFVRQGTLWAQRVNVRQRTMSGEPTAVADSVAFEPIDGTGAFSTSDTGVLTYRAGRPTMTRLSWFDRSGNPLGILGSAEQIGLTNLRLSPDGRRVAVERSVQGETDVWVLDSSHQTRFTHGPDGTLARLPLWSPDGARIAFESVRAGTMTLSAKPSGEDGPEDSLFTSPDVKIPCDWSPDGRFLVYYVPNPKSGTDLWVLPRETRVPFIFLRTEANELWGQFSPDGHWLAYQSNETGRYEIYVRPFPARGGPTAISTAGGVYPRWSRDGKELYFIAPDAKMMAASIRMSATTLDAEVPAALFQTRRLGGGSNVIGRSHQYDVAADGRFLINVDAELSATPITLLLNWNPQELRSTHR